MALLKEVLGIISGKSNSIISDHVDHFQSIYSEFLDGAVGLKA